MLNQFLSLFPKIQLPVTLTEDLIHIFSQNNDPLPQHVIDEFLLSLNESADEFTEFIPCFAIPDTQTFHAVVYWKAALMRYEYVLLTLDKDGKLIGRQVVAGTFSGDNALVQSVATIDEDWSIVVMSGETALGKDFEAASSKMTKMELLPEGHIVQIS